MNTTYDLFGESSTVQIRNRNAEFKIKGLTYIPDFVSQSEHDFLLSEIDKQPWLYELKRRVQHYGYKYDYKFHRINHSMRIAELPDWLQNFAERLSLKITPET